MISDYQRYSCFLMKLLREDDLENLGISSESSQKEIDDAVLLFSVIEPEKTKDLMVKVHLHIAEVFNKIEFIKDYEQAVESGDERKAVIMKVHQRAKSLDW